MVVQLSPFFLPGQQSPSSAPSYTRADAGGHFQGAAQNFSHLCRAFSLVQDRYVDLGYAKPNKSGMRVSLWNLLPQTTTFIVEEDSEVQGTLSIVLDSTCGLPCEPQFHGELNLLRDESRYVAEATMFACGAGEVACRDVSRKLMAMALRWCFDAGVDDLCLVVNPRHILFYEKILGFQRLGTAASIGHAEGNPGVLFRCDLAAGRSGQTELNRHTSGMLRAAMSLETFASTRVEISVTEAAFFLQSEPTMYAAATAEQQATLERLYPGVPMR